MTVVLTGGGTGGHIYPALAIGEALARRGAAILFIGNGAGLEATLVPKHGVPFAGVTVGNISRTSAPVAGAAILRGVREAVALLRGHRAEAIVSTGGYVSAPVVLAGALCGVKIVLHEPNAVAGRANKWLSRFATRVAVGFAETARDFPPQKAVVTGVSIRTPAVSPERGAAREMFGLSPEKPTLLVFGGSQGSLVLNENVLSALDRIEALGFQVLHQTGPKHFEGRAKEETARRESYRAVPYIEDMAAAYAAADVAVCRAGASTLAEIALFSVPAIFVPLPIAGGHQRDNGAIYARADAARLLDQHELSPETLCRELSALADPAAREAVRLALRPFARPNAADDIAGIALMLAGR